MKRSELLHRLSVRAATLAAGHFAGFILAAASAAGFRYELRLVLAFGFLAACFAKAAVFQIRECWRLHWLTAVEQIWEKLR